MFEDAVVVYGELKDLIKFHKLVFPMRNKFQPHQIAQLEASWKDKADVCSSAIFQQMIRKEISEEWATSLFRAMIVELA